MKLSHIAEAALNQMSGQRCHPHMAPINTVGPDGPHPRVLKELSSVITAVVWDFPSSPTVWWHGAVGLEAGWCDNNLQERV